MADTKRKRPAEVLTEAEIRDPDPHGQRHTHTAFACATLPSRRHRLGSLAELQP